MPNPTSSGPEERPHVPALDGIRGMAILAVLTFHVAITMLPADGAIGLLVLRAGWIGVDLFFVLSGFLITGILYDARASTRYFSNFYIRRTLRIFPLYYGVLAVVLVAVPSIRPYHTPVMQGLVREQTWFWLYGTNVALIRTPAEEFGPLLHFWSLAVEEQFYLIWPAVIWALSRRQAMGASVACIVGALALRVLLWAYGVNPFAIYVLTPCRLDALAVGALIALALRQDAAAAHVKRAARFARWVCGSAIVALFALRGGLRNVDPVVQTLGFTCFAGFFGGIVAECASPGGSPVFRRIFEGAALRSLGKYSYGLYVFHPLVFALPLDLLAAPVTASWSRAGVATTLAVLKIGLTFLVALVSWHAYEAPLMRLRRLFA